MRVVGVKDFGGPEALQVFELPERHAGSGDAPADDEQIEGLRGEPLEVLLPLPGVEVHRSRIVVTPFG